MDLGTLVVKLGADSSGLTKGIKQASTSLADFGAQAKQIGGQVRLLGSQMQMFGLAAAGGIGLAVRTAAETNHGLAVELNRVKAGFTSLAQTVGAIFLPAMHSLANVIGQASNWFKSLSPETKKQIEFWGEMAVAVGVGGFALVKLGGALQAAGAALSLVAGLAGTAFLPLAAGALAAVFAFGVMYHAWHDTSEQMKEDFGSNFLKALKLGFTPFVMWFQDQFDAMTNVVFKAMALMEEAGAKVADLMHMPQTAKELHNNAVADFGADASTRAGAVKNVAVEINKAIVSGFDYSLKGLKFAMKDLFASFTRQSKVAEPDRGPRVVEGKLTDKEMTEGDEALWQNLKKLGEQFEKITKDMEEAEQESKRWATEVEHSAMAAQAAALSGLTDKVKSSLGKAAGLADSFGQGTLAAGGNPLGGAAAMAGDLLMQSAEFQKVIGAMDGTIQKIADALGALLVPLEPFITAIGDIAVVLVQAAVGLVTLLPGFQLMSGLMKGLSAVLEPIQFFLQLLAPLFDMIGKMFARLTGPLDKLGEGAMRGLFTAIKGAALGFIQATRLIGGVWNGLIDTFEGMIKPLVNFTLPGGSHPFANLQNTLAGLEANRMDLTGLDDIEKAVAEATYDEMKAKIANTAATNKATESMTNVPTGLKVALARFNAARTGAGSGAGAPSSSTGATTGNGGTGPGQPPAGYPSTLDVHVDGSVVDAKFRVELRDSHLRQFGSSSGLSPSYAGGGV